MFNLPKLSPLIPLSTDMPHKLIVKQGQTRNHYFLLLKNQAVNTDKELSKRNKIWMRILAIGMMIEHLISIIKPILPLV